MSANPLQLENVQRWFQASITHPDGCDAGLISDLAGSSLPGSHRGLQDIVLPSNALNSKERLSIYANMYFDRLIDILADEFPTVSHLLGETTFAEVAKSYVTQHPSTHYSLARLGERFPQFLLEENLRPAIQHAGFASAVATVERSMEDVFDEDQVEPLSPEELQSIPPDRWHEVRLKTIPALRLLKLPYSVNGYMNAVRDERGFAIPDASGSFMVIYRLNYRVWRIEVEEIQFTLLTELQQGVPLGEAISICTERHIDDAAVLVDSLQEWFQNWSAEGLIHQVTMGSV